MTTDIVKDTETVQLLLRRIHFFDGLGFEDLDRISELVSIISLEPKEIVFRQGDSPVAFYIIEKGRVEIIRETSDGEEVLATLGRSGDFFGEMALIEDRPRSATIRSLTPTRLLVISRPDFKELFQQYPSIHLEVTKALSHNLRHSDTRFTEKILEKNRQLAEALSELKAAQEELIRRERLSLVGKLTSGIIHDLKKPLTCVSGYAQLLANQSLEPDRRKKYSSAVTMEVRRLVNMVNEILRFARGEKEIVLQKVNLKEWLQDMAEFLAHDFEGSGITFQKSIKYDGFLMLDSEKFRNVFYNITTNALAAMPDGGAFTVSCYREGDDVRLDFSDTGVGMAPEVQQHVFEDFFTQRADGTGLGMAIVKRIVEGHQGTVSVESELGKGTCFTIRLPLPSDGKPEVS